MAQTTLGDGLIIGAGDKITFGDSTVLASSPNGFKNILINPNFSIDQRNAGAAQTITAAAALAYTVDRWYGYCTGANATGQRVAGTAPNQYNYRYTGAASVTKIGHAQRIEAANSQHLAGTTATLSVDLANSLLTTVTWTAWYANTADTFGTLASPTRTSIGTGTFTVTSTLTRYNTQISIPSGATTGIEVEFSVAAQTSGTWTIGRAQLEASSVATPFETRLYGTELALCQRYLPAFIGYGISDSVGMGLIATATAGNAAFAFPVTSRIPPTGIIVSNVAHFNVYAPTGSASTPTGITIGGLGVSTSSSGLAFSGLSGRTAGQAAGLLGVNASAKILFDGCEL